MSHLLPIPPPPYLTLFQLTLPYHSVHGGMGACLLSDVEKASSIIRHLSTNLTVPVMAKIRMLDTAADTIAFIRALAAAGCSAVTVHLRKRSVESTVPAANWEEMKQIVEGVRPFPGISHHITSSQVTSRHIITSHHIIHTLSVITHPLNPTHITPSQN